MPESLRYRDQVIEYYDPDVGLMLPEQLAACVSLTGPEGSVDDAGAVWLRKLTTLLRDPGAPRLRTLILADWTRWSIDPYDVPYEEGDPAPLLRKHAGRLAALERLYVGGFPARLHQDVCQGIGPELGRLPALTRLEMIAEQGWNLLAPAGHPRLRELVVRVREPDDEPLATLIAGAYPSLANLELVCSDELRELAEDGSLLAGLAELPALRWLALRELDAAAIEGLAGAAGLGGIERLSLVDAPELDDAALAPLLAAAWLPKLARLDLMETGASAGLAAELGARGPAVTRA